MARQRVLHRGVGVGVAQEGDVDFPAAQRAHRRADREHAGHEGVVSPPRDKREHAGHASVLIRADRDDRTRPRAPHDRGASRDVGQGADEECVEARGIEEDPLGFFADRRSHVVGE